MAKPDVSIVMCTFNRADMVGAAVASLCKLRTDGFTYEIVVVDNASTDDTQRIVREHARTSPVPVRLVYERKPGGVHAHNRGIDEAQGEWIAWFDDDEIADANWLVELMKIAAERNVRSIGGAVKLQLPEGTSEAQLTPECRRLLGESNGWSQPRKYNRREGPGSGNQLLHRSVFTEVGVYDEYYNRRGYDTDLYRRIRKAGIESWYTPHAIVYHVTPPLRLGREYLRQTSLNNGWCFARRDQAEWGRAVATLLTGARILKAAVIHVPRLVWGWLTRNRETTLGARCAIWRVEGYMRAVLEQTRAVGIAASVWCADLLVYC